MAEDISENFVALNEETLVGLLVYKGGYGSTPDLIAAPKDVVKEILDKYIPKDKVNTLSILPLKAKAVQAFLKKTQFGTLRISNCEEYEQL